MATALLKKPKRRSTRTDLWFPTMAGLQGSFNAKHICLKWDRMVEQALGATRRQKPMRRRTCFMKAVARVVELVDLRSTMMEKVVRLHMAARMYFLPL